MRKYPTVVGLNLGHDGGCAIISDGKIVAIAEERLNRTRYSRGWQASLLYCLQAAGRRVEDVDLFALSCVGPHLPQGFVTGLASLSVHSQRVIQVDHHLSHAYGAFCLSGFNDAVVVVVDGTGNGNDTESYYLADPAAVSKIGGNRSDRPRAGGIGATYESVTNWIGFHEQEAGKTMALAAFGDPEAVGVPLFHVEGLSVEGALRYTHERGMIEIGKRYGIDLGAAHQRDDARSRDLAAWVQNATEQALVTVVGQLLQHTGTTRVCLAGGVAMNCVANEKVRSGTGADLFVLPAGSDRGQALGNALVAFHRLTGEQYRRRLETDEFGRAYDDEMAHLALRRHPWSELAERHPRHTFSYWRDSDPASVAAQLLAAGKIIGWFQGGSELGARALGRRSILADPRMEETRDRLNRQIKHREWFRPFAPAVCVEDAAAWFETPVPSPFMLFASKVRTERRQAITGAVHVDGSARVQTVDERQDPVFHRLLKTFGQSTGVPVLLNTSFNDQEPIVETPADAIATFQSTELDALVIGSYVAVKDA